MTTLERRLRAEWDLLIAMVQCNPGRLSHAAASDLSFTVTLSQPTSAGSTLHDIRVVYPVHFPAVPMELYLRSPVLHPNVHPHTGFVCLWERHRVSNTIEHALHKVSAMLAGRLYNANAPHVMQPEALASMQAGGPSSSDSDPLLQGVAYQAPWLQEREEPRGRTGRLT